MKHSNKRRSLLKASLAFSLMAAGGCTAAMAPLAATTGILRGRRLQAGMTVGLAAPASNAAEDEDIRFAIELLQSLGFKAKPAAHLYERDYYLAGKDRDRAADINELFADRNVDAIFCLRGGYGTPRILPYIDFDAIARNPKVIMGYSDITALINAIYARTGLITFHGPVLSRNWSGYSVRNMDSVLQDAGTDIKLAQPPLFDTRRGQVEDRNRVSVLHGGRSSGRLIGGNLSLMCRLLGTPYCPDFRGKILFLEDIGESPYRIDGMLTQLRLAGKLQELAGLVFGKFTETEFEGNSFSVEEVLRDRSADLGIPVLRGLMIGHIHQLATVPVGAMATLDTESKHLVLMESAVA